MVILAIVYDVVQIALTWLLGWIAIGFVASWLMTIWAFLTFGVWFAIKGVSIMRSKRVGTFGLGAVIELIPGLASLPGWTVMVATAILTTRAEDFLAAQSK